ncbi:hypothetical protein, partial [Azospirillum sp. B506]|uniref:hypothetical protein n=1 Tax=Azospirillum sp. B506 TaxID=137721 RepID=UPI001B3BCB8A
AAGILAEPCRYIAQDTSIAVGIRSFVLESMETILMGSSLDWQLAPVTRRQPGWMSGLDGEGICPEIGRLVAEQAFR